MAMSDKLKAKMDAASEIMLDLVSGVIDKDEFDRRVLALTLETPQAPVDVSLPSMFPVITDEDWRWSYNFSHSRWELQKHYAEAWHMVRFWTVQGIFLNPAATREHVQTILNQCGVNFTSQRDADPEMERILQEEEEIEQQAERERLDKEQQLLDAPFIERGLHDMDNEDPETVALRRALESPEGL